MLVDIDTQYDFMNPRGKLYIPGASDIIPGLTRVFSNALDRGEKIISTLDWHPMDDEEFKKFPPHCIEHTFGAGKIHPTDVYNKQYICDFMPDREEPADIESRRQYYLYKSCTDIWDPAKGNPSMFTKLIQMIQPEHIFVCGVALDICVINAIKGLLTFNIPMTLLTDAVKGISDEGKALEDIARLGVCLGNSSGML